MADKLLLSVYVLSYKTTVVFFLCTYFRDPFYPITHNKYILFLFQSHKKFSSRHYIRFDWFTVQTDAWSQAIVLRIELNLLLKSDRFKYLRNDRGNKKGRKTIFVIIYSPQISVELNVHASDLRNRRHIINSQLMGSKNVATGPCDASEHLSLLN